MSKAPPGPNELGLRAMREAKVERMQQEAKAAKPKPKTRPAKSAKE